MPVETDKSIQQPIQNTPKKKQTGTSGKAALAKITLLDGSLLEVTIDVSWMLFCFICI
jgi:hypothetical protein